MSHLFKRFTLLWATAGCLLALTAVLFSPPAATSAAPAEDGELLLNGGFETGLEPWWVTANVSPNTAGQNLVATVTNGGVNRWDAIVGQHNLAVQLGGNYTLTFSASASTPVTVTVIWQQNGGSYTTYFSSLLPLTSNPQTFNFNFTAAHDDPAGTFQFQIGGQGDFVLTLDEVSLVGPLPNTEPPPALPIIRLNQVGYLPAAPKWATVVHTSTTPLNWTIYDVTQTVVLTGTTIIFGENVLSDEHIHHVDFSVLQTEGMSYTLAVADEVSHPFNISAEVYSQLKYDALAYFYHNRSGITLTMPYAGGEQWTRPAGHLNVAPNTGDFDVPCFDQTDTQGQQWEGCNYTLDVVGGWYDAGDHGKYVVNGGISVWTLLNLYERGQFTAGADAAAFADGMLNIPENSNEVSDLLDEAWWQMNFMLSMQVPMSGTVEGELLEGMVHHKVHDANWTGLGLAPHEDAQTRYLYPPSTAATLNLAATAAQCARIFEDIDPAKAEQCLTAAERAWQAAVAHPTMYAANNFTGGGPYDDTDVSDEFYWAAAELFVTTGDEMYSSYLITSTHYLTIPAGSSALGWQQVAGLGTISLATVPNSLPAADVDQAQQAIVEAADGYLATLEAEGYRLPFTDEAYPWGSNSSVLNNMLMVALAYDLTGEVGYFNGVSQGMDYLLGHNPVDQSYISGYGERPLQNPHHRFWANQLDDAFPSAPAGAVSGGPNSGIQDPYAQTIFPNGCPPQLCFVDHIDSWSTNEITINWNAPLAWVAFFLDEQGGESVNQQIFLPVVVHD